MRQLFYTIAALLVIAGTVSCDPKSVEANFEDMINITIYDYVVENDSMFSSFLKVLEAGGIDKTLSAYNPDGLDYTLFLPTNEAMDLFISESDQFSSLDQLLADKVYVSALSRYHVVNMGIKTDDFPFGALPELTLSEDILTVGFIVKPDTSYYSINNQAPVIIPNVETSNGWVHVVSHALTPVTNTTYAWMELHDGFNIFTDAVDLVGLDDDMDLNIKDENKEARPFTLFLEHDSVFNRRGIFSVEDLAAEISPGDDNYTSINNPLYNFVAYHMLAESWFLADFVDVSTNYTTHSDIPLNVNGLGLDILINKGKQDFDTIISGPDTTIINYIGFFYDESNVLTQSGALHFIDQILRQVPPSRQIQTFQFAEEPLFAEYRQDPGEYLIEDPASLFRITWRGPDLMYVKEADVDFPAWSQDYLSLTGDFLITYTIPSMVQGNYMVLLGAEAFNNLNALVEVAIDGKSLGGLIDLTSGGSPDNPFAQIELGTMNFLKYEEHVIEVRSLIPGRFLWDYIRFEPY
jgi:uncharacterized surface protein with fasciclin (FAS1) repeats